MTSLLSNINAQYHMTYKSIVKAIEDYGYFVSGHDIFEGDHLVGTIVYTDKQTPWIEVVDNATK